MQGRDRLIVKYVAEQLGLEGSYISRTYIEQIQLEKLVNEIMVLTTSERLLLLLSFSSSRPNVIIFIGPARRFKDEAQ